MIRRINSSRVSLFFLLLILNVLILPEWVQQNKSSYLDDPINSIAEFVMEVCLDFEDLTPGDEREDDAPFSNYAKHINYFLINDFMLIKQPVWSGAMNNTHLVQLFFASVYFDINTPPPERA